VWALRIPIVAAEHEERKRIAMLRSQPQPSH
jgi:hypothetical protein